MRYVGVLQHGDLDIRWSTGAQAKGQAKEAQLAWTDCKRDFPVFIDDVYVVDEVNGRLWLKT